MTIKGPTVADAMLEPCPFCGTAAEVVVFGKGQANERHGVRCADLTCGAMVRLGTKPGESVALWNTRTATNRASEGGDGRIETLFDAIAHGDDEHRTWLKEAIGDHFAGRPVPRPRGGSRKEARIAELEALLAAKPDPEPTRADLAEMLHRVSDRVRGGLTVDAGMVGAIDALLSREGGSDAA